MRRLQAPARVERLLEEAIARFELDLTGINVLTEAASGPFVLTPLIAARAGASVVAVTRDSRFGSAGEVRAYASEWARHLDVADAVEVYVGSGLDRAGDADLVTNLGFVRPIDAEFARRAKAGAAVALMSEPWELRPSDVDVAACRAAGMAVLGTDEQDPRVQTFRFVGVLALKLLLELEIELLASRILVVSSEPFASPIVRMLRDVGATVTLADVTAGCDLRSEPLTEACRMTDAVVVAEHRDRRTVLGGSEGLSVDALAAAGAVVAHIAGALDDAAERLCRHPAGSVAPGYMTVTTDVVGPRPVIDLHGAGLRVGQALVQGVRRFGDARQAEAFALRDSPALAVDSPR